MEIEEGNYLAHYGIRYRSGRYPWGSGGHNETARSKRFLDYVKDLQKQGMKQKEIADIFGMSINDLRASKSIASNQQKQSNIGLAQRLRDKGNSPTEISRRMKQPEATVRSWLLPGAKDNVDKLTGTANALKKEVNEKWLVDIGRGNEISLGVSTTRLSTAVLMLKQEGYEVHHVPAPQVTGGHNTNIKVLTPPGWTRGDVYRNRDKIQQVQSFSEDGGKIFGQIKEPLLLHPNRVQVVYGHQGGGKSDGMIYVRDGVEDLSIGGAKYAQVRVAVGKDHYLKGMAMPVKDLPPGVDVQFHTGKSDTGNKLDAMKKNKEEKGYIEGGPHVLLKSVKRQILADPDTDNERVVSVMNIVDEEGAWNKWSENMSSQMLSKQSPILAKSQLNMTYERTAQEFENVKRLTNNTVKKKMLEDLSNSTDSSAVHLQAAALPRTANRIILPIISIKPTEVYAPQFEHGENVVLIRHPHGGPFEIPSLTVNNNNREGKRLLGQARDAIGIHPDTAKHLSGADFDGDTVLVIPNRQGRVKSSKMLDELKDFDPKRAYPAYPGMKRMANTQKEMGEISNLITDMSLRKAPIGEIAQAIRHSMVVIDAEKHNLNHKESFKANGIANLKKKYQTGGASTIISRARSQHRIPERKPRTRAKGGPVDLETGRLMYEPTGNKKADGTPVMRKFKRLAVTDDARELMSSPVGTPMEKIYADHSNKLKGLANEMRLTRERTPNPTMSKSAKKAFAAEVITLNNKLELARKNAPLERMANTIAHAKVKMRKEAYPDMDEETEKKISFQELTQARIRTGATKHDIQFTDQEWEAVQQGAISHSVLNQILQHADMNDVRRHATPKTELKMTPTKKNRMRLMIEQGYPLEQIAEDLGVSVSTLENTK